MSRTIIYVHVYIILDFPITYSNALECASLHKTVIMAVFFVKSNENTYPKGRALILHSCPSNEKREFGSLINNEGNVCTMIYLFLNRLSHSCKCTELSQ